MGFDTADDAAVYRIAPGIAIVNTLDFITPILDDPYQFGRVAAANALSDVYAMGGKPVLCLSIVCFPIGELDSSILSLILQGACAAIVEAGAVLAGGHTVDDPALKFGLAVTGTVCPDALLTNAGARAGDFLVLTKPLGTGIVTTGIKQGLAQTSEIEAVTTSMATLNRAASEAICRAGAHACTDVTGFGLLGHLHQMARESGLSARVFTSALPILPGALDLARRGVGPGGQKRNLAYVAEHVTFGDVSEELRSVAVDPQTSGGLLAAVPPNRLSGLLCDLQSSGALAAAVVGECREGIAGTLVVE